ncbi:hypothetical protein ACH4SK_43790 [Streptomyces inhibens]|uniref:hypothetical protein n=1 Tax=Streptomyces inhibens TaxID=2293571 RepID=UPI0037B41DD4
MRFGLGPTRDIVVVDCTAEPVDIADLAPKTGDAFAVKTRFDPRELDEPYQYFLIRPRRIRAWREANERQGRDLRRDGRWLG